MGTPQAISVPGGVATARVTDGGNCFHLNSVVAGETEADLQVRPVGVSQFQALLQALAVDARQPPVAAPSRADWTDTDGAPHPGRPGAGDLRAAALPHPRHHHP